MTLEELNHLTHDELHSQLRNTCGSNTWVESMCKLAPFVSVEVLLELAVSVWQRLTEKDHLEAFEAHPMIGDLDTLKARFSSTREQAGNEQAGTAVASEEILVALKEANQRYLQRFGFIFIICASGLSAEAMLNALNARLNNSRGQELENAAREQIRITRLRLVKLLGVDTSLAR